MSTFLGNAGEVEVLEISTGRHQFDDLLDEEDVPVDVDGFSFRGPVVQVENSARMAAICHHDTDFIYCHDPIPG